MNDIQLTDLIPIYYDMHKKLQYQAYIFTSLI